MEEEERKAWAKEAEQAAAAGMTLEAWRCGSPAGFPPKPGSQEGRDGRLAEAAKGDALHDGPQAGVGQ